MSVGATQLELADEQRAFADFVVGVSPASDVYGPHAQAYRYQYRARLRAAIDEDFPHTIARYGMNEAEWDRFCRELKSDTYTLNVIGRYWLRWLEGSLANPRQLELARLEWALCEAAFATGGARAPLALATDAESSLGGIRFAPGVCLRRVSVAVWREWHQAEGELDHVQPTGGEVDLVLWRDAAQGRVEALDPVSAAVLSWLLVPGVASVAHALEAGLEARGWGASETETAFQRLAALGVIESTFTFENN